MRSGAPAVRVVVYGRVKGVFFRASCRARARDLGVHGWVRNRSDSTVEAVFAGPASDVDAMVAWTRTGPPQAAVTEVRVEPADDPGGTHFHVR